jgi:predicted dienelactone hydrolase
VYSHGFPSTRLDDVHLFTHLASYGFVVVSADHPGSNFVSPSGDPAFLTNRPLDLRFLIDQFLAFNAEAATSWKERSIPPATAGAATRPEDTRSPPSLPALSSSAPSPIHA